MSRTKLVAYWATTGWVALGMAGAGVANLLRVPESLEGFVRLGYPLHFAVLLGIWKILGAIAIVAPGFPRLKEWAYAGITIDLTGAAFAWAVVGAGDAATTAGHIAAPLAGLVAAAFSWALRPESRRLPGRDRVLVKGATR